MKTQKYNLLSLLFAALLFAFVLGCEEESPTTPAADGTVNGRITDAVTNNGISGATVASDDNHTTTTNATGNYTLTVGAGARRITASMTGYVSNTANVTVTSSGTHTVNIALVQANQPATLHGQVYEASGGSITGVATLTDDLGNTTQTGVMDAYSLNTTSGRRIVTVTCNGYITVVDTVDVLPGAQGNDHDFYLFRTGSGGALKGKVLKDSDGNPLEGAMIVADNGEHDIADANGTYYIAVPPGNRRFTVTHGGYTPIIFDTTIVSGYITEKDFRMVTAPQGTINGSVKDAANNQAIAGAWVVADDGSEVETDNQGNYSFRVTVGNRILAAYAQGYEEDIDSVQVTANGTHTVNFLLNRVSSTKATVQGRVLKASNNEPIANAIILTDEYNYVATNPQGHFSIEVSAGTHWISATASGYNTEIDTLYNLVAGQTYNHDFLLVAAIAGQGTVHGQVINAQTNAPLAGAYVASDNGENTTTDNNGNYSFTVASGQRNITVTIADYYPHTEVVWVVENMDYTLNFALYPVVAGRGIIFGTVTNAQNGEPITGATVNADDGTYTFTDGSGDYSMEVSAGPRTVVVVKEDFTPLERDIVVTPGGNHELNFILSPVLVGQGVMRFVLSWNEQPEDLDSYLRTPEIQGNQFEIYYGDEGSEASPPYAKLDRDDVDGYGPETITIYQLFEGTYNYWVHNYSRSPAIAGCGAVVNIYDENGLLQTINIPASGSGLYWNVCTVDGATGRVTVINTIVSERPFNAGDAPLRPKN